MTALVNTAPAFASFAELAADHDALLGHAEDDDRALKGVDEKAIRSFVERAALAGAVIVDPQERKEARRILNFWASELITRDSSGSWQAPRLVLPEGAGAEDETGAAGASPAPSSADIMEAASRGEAADPQVEETRELLRISGLARQWLRADKEDGWLLTGDALHKAELVAPLDPIVRDFVTAGRIAESERARSQYRKMVVAIAVLASLCVALIAAGSGIAWTYLQLRQSYSQLAKEKADNEALGESLAVANAETQRQTQAQLTEQTQRNRMQQAELDRKEVLLRDAGRLLAKMRGDGRLDATDIPERLQQLIEEIEAPNAEPGNFLPDNRDLVRGYDLFLTPLGAKSPGIAIAMPALRDSGNLAPVNDGKPIDYVNFSLIISGQRRMPAISAVSLRRSEIVAMQRPIRTAWGLDPRVLAAAQGIAEGGAGIDRGQLVGARDIAWGPAFGGGPGAAGQLAYAMTQRLTNVTPQFAEFNRNAWDQLETYGREGFAPRADQVTIFSGPFFSKDDPVIAGIQVPKVFWKVLVAIDPDNQTQLIVEAYVLPQIGSDGQKLPAYRFDPNSQRIALEDLERLAKLDFGPILRSADTAWRLASQSGASQRAGTSPVDNAVARIASPDKAERLAALQGLLTQIRDPNLPDAVLRRMAEAALASLPEWLAAQKDRPDAVVNGLTLLAAIPDARWHAPGWINFEAAARRVIADGGATLGCGAEGLSQACKLITGLKTSLDFNLAVDRTVYFQFAGMVRQDAQTLSSQLKLLGWVIPGEERTGAAANVNQVRYSAEQDRAAAEMLAADLRALGRSTVKAVKISGIRPGFPEVWVSN